MPLLSAFEAAARLEGITAAAAELNLTQSAVSRQVRELEGLLGLPLFERHRQRVRLTAAGRDFAGDIREALNLISSAALAVRANPGGGMLNLAVLPTFGTRWLAPRLQDFVAKHPGITINLTTRLKPFDFDLDRQDAAIHFGQLDWPGIQHELLMGEAVIPTCSPEMRARMNFRVPADLLQAPILHLASRPDAWTSWFRSLGVEVDQVPGMVIDQFATAAQAVSSGMGVALMPTFLIEPELARGELASALDVGPFAGQGHYYLVWPPQRRDHRPLNLFKEWLRCQIDLFVAQAGRHGEPADRSALAEWPRRS